MMSGQWFHFFLFVRFPAQCCNFAEAAPSWNTVRCYLRAGGEIGEIVAVVARGSNSNDSSDLQLSARSCVLWLKLGLWMVSFAMA